MAKEWAAAEKIVILAFVLVILAFFHFEQGREQLFSVIDSYYGILLLFLIVLHYKKGWWSLVPLWVVVTTSLAIAVHNNPDVMDVLMKEGALHSVFLYLTAVLSVDIYHILHTPQITITDRQLVLNFGRTRISWENVSEIRLDENHLEVEKKERKFTLFPVWESIGSIADQGDLITSLSEYCYERDIPFSKL